MIGFCVLLLRSGGELDSKRLKVFDLFAGVGGFSLGLHWTGGFETVAFCENDNDCQKILSKNFPGIPILGDVETVSGFTLSEMVGGVDVICGGFPCQDVSFAGGKKGIRPVTRSGLWFSYLRLIDEVEPRYAIIENVEHLKKNGLAVVLNGLARIGYDAEWYCLTATGVANLPHQRKRLFIISYPSRERLHEHHRRKRSLHSNSKRKNQKAYFKRKKCEFEPIPFCPLLSRRAIEDFRNSKADRGAVVSRVRRVTNGIPKGLDEDLRQARIKQLGNAIVPQIAELIGRRIL